MSRRASRNGAGSLKALVRGKRFVIVVSRFNPSITEALVRGAVGVLRRSGTSPRQIRTVRVPGAFELPVAAARLARQHRHPHAIIALGAVIRGQTPQYQAIAQAVAQGLTAVSVTAGIPVTFGLIVADSAAKARARAGGSMGNRGAEAAMAALEMVQVFRSL